MAGIAQPPQLLVDAGQLLVDELISSAAGPTNRRPQPRQCGNTWGFSTAHNGHRANGRGLAITQLQERFLVGVKRPEIRTQPNLP